MKKYLSEIFNNIPTHLRGVAQRLLGGGKLVFQEGFYLKTALISASLIGYLYYWLFTQTSTIPDFIRMTRDGDFGPYSLVFAIIYWTTTILTILLFGLSVSILVWLWRNSLFRKVYFSFNLLGAVTGAFASACPICGAFLFSLIGVSSGLAIFPFKGLELKIISFVLILTSVILALHKISTIPDCSECQGATLTHSKKRTLNIPLEKALLPALTILFLVNQYYINDIAAKVGLAPKTNLLQTIFQIKSKPTYTIIAPKLNPDGKITSLVEQPTISEVPANPKTKNALADAKVVMIATGKPSYAPEDVSFDNPVNAQNKWGVYEKSIKLNEEQ